MSSYLARTSLRVEDLLTAAFVLALTAVGSLGTAVRGVALSERNFWELTYFLAPLSILVFLAALRYAIGGDQHARQTIFRRLGRLLRDWLPFLTFLLIYQSFNNQLWKALFAQDRDAELLALDRFLFGETPSVPMQSLIHPWLTDAMTVAYFLHLLLPPVLALAWYKAGRRGFREYLLSILVIAVLGTTGYVLVPAVGPGVAYPELFHISLESSMYEPITSVMDAARAPRDVFPSLHVGLSSLVLWYGYRLSRRWFWILLLPVVANWVSTVYLRYHYLVDVFAGWVVAAVAIWIAGLLLVLESRWKPARLEGERT